MATANLDAHARFSDPKSAYRGMELSGFLRMRGRSGQIERHPRCIEIAKPFLQKSKSSHGCWGLVVMTALDGASVCMASGRGVSCRCFQTPEEDHCHRRIINVRVVDGLLVRAPGSVYVACIGFEQAEAHHCVGRYPRVFGGDARDVRAPGGVDVPFFAFEDPEEVHGQRANVTVVDSDAAVVTGPRCVNVPGEVLHLGLFEQIPRGRLVIQISHRANLLRGLCGSLPRSGPGVPYVCRSVMPLRYWWVKQHDA